MQGFTKDKKEALINHIIGSLNNTASKAPKAMIDKTVRINDNGKQLLLPLTINQAAIVKFYVKGKAGKKKMQLWRKY